MTEFISAYCESEIFVILEESFLLSYFLNEEFIMDDLSDRINSAAKLCLGEAQAAARSAAAALILLKK